MENAKDIKINRINSRLQCLYIHMDQVDFFERYEIKKIIDELENELTILTNQE